MNVGEGTEVPCLARARGLGPRTQTGRVLIRAGALFDGRNLPGMGLRPTATLRQTQGRLRPALRQKKELELRLLDRGENLSASPASADLVRERKPGEAGERVAQQIALRVSISCALRTLMDETFPGMGLRPTGTEAGATAEWDRRFLDRVQGRREQYTA
jgi:hypothetical protein